MKSRKRRLATRFWWIFASVCVIAIVIGFVASPRGKLSIFDGLHPRVYSDYTDVGEFSPKTGLKQFHRRRKTLVFSEPPAQVLAIASKLGEVDPPFPGSSDQTIELGPGEYGFFCQPDDTYGGTCRIEFTESGRTRIEQTWITLKGRLGIH